jgi:hypothetical protein
LDLLRAFHHGAGVGRVGEVLDFGEALQFVLYFKDIVRVVLEGKRRLKLFRKL